MPVENENLGIAFGLVIGAGLSTALGAGVVFFPSLVKYADRRTLAGALGLSAGVMTYVSFVEIFQKSIGSFEDSGLEENVAYAYATLCFFGGVFFMVVSRQCACVVVACRSRSLQSFLTVNLSLYLFRLSISLCIYYWVDITTTIIRKITCPVLT